MRLIQFTTEDGERRVGRVRDDGDIADQLPQVDSVYQLARTAMERGEPLAAAVEDLLAREGRNPVDYASLLEAGRVLPPLDHPDPAHCLISGTGLTHLGSAQARHTMHAAGSDVPLTDSMRLFRLGVDGGKPAPGRVGVQPEWFYKGDGRWLVAPGQPLIRPSFALDGGEEAEIVGCYVIGEDGAPYRVGFALGNEFSDHVLEKQNYLYLAHSKLRTSAVGPEVRLGPLPAHVEGRVRILRGDDEVWSAPFVSGEANMSHSLANLEHHHFKYSAFRRPGDVHLHFFGTATLSSAAGVDVQPGDCFEMEAAGFGRPLRNPMQMADQPEPVTVRTL